jgi:RNA 2',3'-cyclic 3'-phosphodiesterase
MRPRNSLYIMAKPPRHVQAQITAPPRNDPSRGPDLLHVTLMTL